ncbi:hypothetical protein [Aliiroseovarius subalbicans]|uniref:hypothetical protein n=1 Tax=Aliiroseovarius subalbicans TaxID=2925840 RepID=UPI001F584A3D|nr:hypothetical protein [Aliiroseovarius subalbicans]MCI2400719.1 hypothetical protein [Aliiroseovarius subalbicans]
MKPLALFAVLGLALAASPGLGQQSYPLACHGSAKMVALSGVSVNATTNTSVQFVTVHFHKTSTGALKRTPPPGACSWLDRPVAKTEPAQMTLSSETYPAHKETRVAISPFTTLATWATSDQVFYVHAYNNGNGTLVVTKLGR